MSKILLITYGFPPDVGGAELVAYDYASNLAALGHDVTVVCREHKGEKKHYGFPVMEFSARFGERLWMLNLFFFLRKLDCTSYDYIILNQSQSSAVAGRVFSKIQLRKCIPIIQGFEVEWFYDNRRWVSNMFNNWLFRLKKYHRETLLGCRKIVSVSLAHKNKVLCAAGLEHLASKVQVVYTGIDKEVFHYEANSYKKSSGLDDRHLLFSVSRIVVQKGYGKMLRIFDKLVRADSSFHWLIAGDGPYLAELKEQVQQLSLSDHVTFLGNVDRNELRYYYSASDCFWLLSDYDECLPLAYLEAQACGLPAVGRNKGGVVETIIDGKTGFLINSDDECLNILLHREYEKIRSEALKEFVDGFDKVKAANLLIS